MVFWPSSNTSTPSFNCENTNTFKNSLVNSFVLAGSANPFQPNICFRFRSLTCDPDWTGFWGLKKKAVYMGCRRERTTDRVVIRRFQIRFQTIMGSVNSIENVHCWIPLWPMILLSDMSDSVKVQNCVNFLILRLFGWFYSKNRIIAFSLEIIPV